MFSKIVLFGGKGISRLTASFAKGLLVEKPKQNNSF